jgi:hypothetical protein
MFAWKKGNVCRNNPHSIHTTHSALNAQHVRTLVITTYLHCDFCSCAHTHSQRRRYSTAPQTTFLPSAIHNRLHPASERMRAYEVTIVCVHMKCQLGSEYACRSITEPRFLPSVIEGPDQYQNVRVLESSTDPNVHDRAANMVRPPGISLLGGHTAHVTVHIHDECYLTRGLLRM